MAEIQSDARVLEDGDDALHSAAETDTTDADGIEFAKIEDLKSESTVAEDAPAAPAAPEKTPAPAADEDADLPTEFRGKSRKEIAKMYQDAHKLIGRQGMELGELRGKVDLAVRLASEGLRRTPAEQPAKPQQPEQPVEQDESLFFNKPTEAIARAVANSPVIQEIKRALGQQEAERAANRAHSNTERFNRTHPDAPEILRDPEFRKWVSGSRVRQALLQRADKHFDFEAGDEVFSTWKALRGVKPAATTKGEQSTTPAAPAAADVSAAAATLAAARKAKQDAQAKAAAVPTGGASGAGKPSGSKKVYRRADIVRLMVDDPERYEALSDEIRVAYEEGRVR